MWSVLSLSDACRFGAEAVVQRSSGDESASLRECLNERVAFVHQGCALEMSPRTVSVFPSSFRRSVGQRSHALASLYRECVSLVLRCGLRDGSFDRDFGSKRTTLFLDPEDLGVESAFHAGSLLKEQMIPLPVRRALFDRRSVRVKQRRDQS